VEFIQKFLQITLHKISTEQYLILRHFLSQNGVIVLKYLVKCCYSWWPIHCKTFYGNSYIFSGGNLDKSLGLLKRRLEKFGQENFSKHILLRKKKT